MLPGTSLPLIPTLAAAAGTDEQAVGLVGTLAPDYRPWFSPLLGVPGEGVEPWLFALQAGLGLGIVAYYLVLKRRQLRTGRQDGDRAD
jgi:cobalt/nickel transport protein